MKRLRPATGVVLALAVLMGWGSLLPLLELSGESDDSSDDLMLVALGTAVSLALLAHRRSRRGGPLSTVDRAATVAFASTAGSIAVLVVAGMQGRSVLFGLVGAWLVVVSATFVADGIVRALPSRGAGTRDLRRVAVFGVGPEAGEVASLLDDHPETDMVVVGLIGDRSVAERHQLGERWIGSTSEMTTVLEERDVDTVVLTATGFRSPQFKAMSRRLLAQGYEMLVTTGVSRLAPSRLTVRSVVHEPLVVVGSRRPAAWEQPMKRALDLVLGALALVVMSPVMLVVIVAIRLTDRGPIIFRQQRVGMDGSTFEVVKFRSMVPDAEARRDVLIDLNERDGPLFKVSQDPRITRIGALLRSTSLDELPQLINVIKGEMSLVGPRPALPSEVAQFDAELLGRGSVKPGMTGLWQIEARSNASFDAYRRLDLHYVANWSVWEDLRILFATYGFVLGELVAAPFRLVGWGTPADDITSPETDTRSPGPDGDLPGPSDLERSVREGRWHPSGEAGVGDTVLPEAAEAGTRAGS